MYPTFKTIAAAKKAYARCRTRKHFILEGGNADPKCICCGKKLSEDTAPSGYRGNRCEYLPKQKKVAVMHYTCAWHNLLGAIFGTEKLI